MKLAVLSGALSGWPLERMLDELTGAGLDGVELLCGPSGHIHDTSGHALDVVAAAVASRGLAICGLAAPGSWRVEGPELIDAIAAADSLGAPGVRIFAPAYRSDEPIAPQLARFSAGVEALRQATASRAAAILVELSQETLVPSPELAQRVLAPLGTERLGVVYDPANMTVEGNLHPPYAIAVLDGFLKHVHAKNQVLRRRNGTWAPQLTALAQGQVDWDDVLGALARAGYSGWISIDHLSGAVSRHRLRYDASALRALLEVDRDTRH